MPTSSSLRLKRMLVRSGFLSAAEALFWAKHRHRAAKILCYHRILENGYFHRSPLSPETLARRFEQQMHHVARHYRVVPLKEIVRRVRDRAPLPPRCMALTFDDGYRDLHTVGGPVLEKLGLPATCFLATHHTETNRLFAFDALALSFQTTRLHSVSFADPGPGAFSLKSPEDRDRAMRAADRHYKTLPPEQGERFLEELFGRLEVSVPESYPLENGLMNWDEVRQLMRSGVDFQAHSVSHATFSGLSGGQMQRELLGAKEEIEAKTQAPVTVFCYPGGKRENLNEAARDILIRCGYEAAVLGVRGSFRVTDDLFEMKRYTVDADLRPEELPPRISDLFNRLQGRL